VIDEFLPLPDYAVSDVAPSSYEIRGGHGVPFEGMGGRVNPDTPPMRFDFALEERTQFNEENKWCHRR